MEEVLRSSSPEVAPGRNQKKKPEELSYAEISKLKVVFQKSQMNLTPAGKKRKRKLNLNIASEGEDEHSTLFHTTPKRFRKKVVKRVSNRRLKKN